MNNETIMFLRKLSEKIESKWWSIEEDDAGAAVRAVSEAIGEILDEYAPEHTCATEPYEHRMERLRKEREALPVSDRKPLFGAWANTPIAFFSCWQPTYGVKQEEVEP